jgi:plasmid stabilization system protein ParE
MKSIEDYHQQFDPDYARLLVKRLFARVEILAHHPYVGSVPKLKELQSYLQLLEKPYRLLYRVDEAQHRVLIVAVIRQSQDILTAWHALKRT